jgi:hypothetical protein
MDAPALCTNRKGRGTPISREVELEKPEGYKTLDSGAPSEPALNGAGGEVEGRSVRKGGICNPS